MIRYANDLELTELTRRLTNNHKSFHAYLTDGNLKAAFLRAHVMGKLVEEIKERLNRIEWPDGVKNEA